jgi:hypothetical protein
LNVCSTKRNLSYSKYSGAMWRARSMRAAGKTTRRDSRRTYFICDVTKGNKFVQEETGFMKQVFSPYCDPLPAMIDSNTKLRKVIFKHI